MISNQTLSIIVPCFNESEGVLSFYDGLKIQLNQLLLRDYEIIFIDDGSTDKTLDVLLEIRNANNKIKIISFSKNYGQQAAIAAGYEYCHMDLILSMDADLQHPVELIKMMLAKINEGYEIILTARCNTKKNFKNLSSHCFYKILNFFSPGLTHMGTSDFRMMTKNVLNELRRFKEHDAFYRGLVPYLGFKQFTLDYTPNPRLLGTTKYSIFKMLRLAMSGLTSFSSLPLHLSTLLGFFISFVAFLYLCYALYVKFILNVAISGWTSIIISVLFIGGVQLFILGIMGEYIGKIFFEVKQRPKFIVRKSFGIDEFSK